MKLIKGHTGEIRGIEATADGRYIATYQKDKTYVNLWDLETEEKVIVTPKFRANVGTEILQLKVREVKKGSTAVLLVTAKENIILFRVKFNQESKTLTASGIIKDEGDNILSCEFINKSNILV